MVNEVTEEIFIRRRMWPHSPFSYCFFHSRLQRLAGRKSGKLILCNKAYISHLREGKPHRLAFSLRCSNPPPERFKSFRVVHRHGISRHARRNAPKDGFLLRIPCQGRLCSQGKKARTTVVLPSSLSVTSDLK